MNKQDRISDILKASIEINDSAVINHQWVSKSILMIFGAQLSNESARQLYVDEKGYQSLHSKIKKISKLFSDTATIKGESISVTDYLISEMGNTPFDREYRKKQLESLTDDINQYLAQSEITEELRDWRINKKPLKAGRPKSAINQFIRGAEDLIQKHSNSHITQEKLAQLILDILNELDPEHGSNAEQVRKAFRSFPKSNNNFGQ